MVEGCLWQEGLYNTKPPDEEQENCGDARVGWYGEVLPGIDPDVVVVMSRPRDDEDEWSGSYAAATARSSRRPG